MSRMIVGLLAIAFGGFDAARAAATYPWGPERECKLDSPRSGIYPSARKILDQLQLLPRITNGLDARHKGDNYHQADNLGHPRYSGAVDLSIRCLNEQEIRDLLGKLADSGFAGWYRRPGFDGWRKAAHIHAIWVGDPLKPVLRRQVNKWLAGQTGLSGREDPYVFWNPDEVQRELIRAAFNASNPGH